MFPGGRRQSSAPCRFNRQCAPWSRPAARGYRRPCSFRRALDIKAGLAKLAVVFLAESLRVHVRPGEGLLVRCPRLRDVKRHVRLWASPANLIPDGRRSCSKTPRYLAAFISHFTCLGSDGDHPDPHRQCACDGPYAQAAIPHSPGVGIADRSHPVTRSG